MKRLFRTRQLLLLTIFLRLKIITSSEMCRPTVEPIQQTPHQVLHRPTSAVGTFLRVITVNDVYNLENYPRVATAVKAAQDASKELDCVVKSFLPGDFLSPSVHTALDGGKTLMGGMNLGRIDYVSLGNHEFDIGFDGLEARLAEFNGMVVNSNIDDAFLEKYPSHATFQIGNRRAVIGGFITDQVDIYPPGSVPSIRPIDSSIPEVWEQAKEKLGGVVPDLFIPMTHQLMPQDQQTAVEIAKHTELGTRTPIILGGHDHEVYIEEAGNSMIVKVGYNAEKIGVIDIWWNMEGKLKSSISLIPCEEFQEEERGAVYAKKKSNQLAKLMNVPITTIPVSGTTKKIRFEESPVGSFLLSKLKRGLASQKVDIVILQAGGIRGLADYESGAFLMGDLFAELAFETPVGIVDVPGWVIAESVRNSRIAEKPAPQFLHMDEDCVVDGESVVRRLNGEPIVMDKIYRVATWLNTLKGVNDIQPLLEYVREHNLVPDDEICRGGKEIFMEICMKDAWRDIIHYDNWDTDHDGVLSPKEIQEGLNQTFAKMDTDGNGIIDKEELVAFMEQGQDIYHGRALAREMILILDADNDGTVSRDELARLAL